MPVINRWVPAWRTMAQPGTEIRPGSGRPPWNLHRDLRCGCTAAWRSDISRIRKDECTDRIANRREAVTVGAASCPPGTDCVHLAILVAG